MTLDAFNTMAADEAAALVRPCADIDSWVEAVVAGRPYASVAGALEAGDAAGRGWTPAEVDQALAHHPRIGDRPSGESTEESMSRSEQAGVSGDEATAKALAEGNRVYEERFDRVFLIRAAGRSAEEILAELDRRLDNDAETEAAEVAQQLREIALLRLEGTLSA